MAVIGRLIFRNLVVISDFLGTGDARDMRSHGETVEHS